MYVDTFSVGDMVSDTYSFKELCINSLIDFNSSQPNYYNPLHYIPLFMLGITSLAGLFVSNKKSISIDLNGRVKAHLLNKKLTIIVN